MTIDAVDEADMPPLTRVMSRINSEVSRPDLIFTAHFIDFLKAQSEDCDAIRQTPTKGCPSVDKMDIDYPISPLSQSTHVALYPQVLAGQWIDGVFEARNSDYVIEKADMDEKAITSPRRNAWDWTGEEVGVALGYPPENIGERLWDR